MTGSPRGHQTADADQRRGEEDGYDTAQEATDSRRIQFPARRFVVVMVVMLPARQHSGGGF
jgi:hypothetical protein